VLRSALVVATLYSVVWQAGLFSADECRALTELPEPWVDAQVTGAGASTGDKRASWQLLELDERRAWVFERVAAFLRAHASYGFELDELASPLKIQRYAPGGFHGWHADLGSADGRRRKLGITVQLSASDAYTGGDLRFFDPPEHACASRARGCGICFPSYVPHEVTPVVTGVRYALTGWAVGPPFR
jgi:PKHD-type hydroxylase